MIHLVRVEHELPEAFPELRAEADAEGYRHMSRLASEMSETPEMFVALLAAYEEGELVGVGGLTVDPLDPSAKRMRRLYVRKRARRRGVARTVAHALLNEALNTTRLVTVHAGNADAARFWEALGFRPTPDRAWSHEFSTA